MKYEAVRVNSPEFSVRKMCKVLGLSVGAYHDWKKRQGIRAVRAELERAVIEQVSQIFEDNKKLYGYRKMHRAVKKAGLNLSEYKVRRIMRENGLYSVVLNKFKVPKRKNPNYKYHNDLVEQRFNPTELNQVWVGDITYIKTLVGWVYLSTVIDLFNREVIGYSISKRMDVELVKQSLSNALAKRGGAGSNTIFHSDRGIQYASKGFRDMLSRYGIIGSMSRSNCPYDNACVESFFSILKKECVFGRRYDTIIDVKRDIFEYIELFYNRKRLHSTLDYMSPVEYRLAHVTQMVA